MEREEVRERERKRESARVDACASKGLGKADPKRPITTDRKRTSLRRVKSHFLVRRRRLSKK